MGLSLSAATAARAVGNSMAGGAAHLGRVMQRSVGGSSATDVATAGLAGGGSEIPYRGEMERSFGRDFSGVRAHTGSAARSANEQLNANAYAMDGQVAFKSSSPDKGLVAHELTHVVQGEKGPARKSADGINTAGEAQADAVQSAVSSGRSASSVLGGSPAVAGANGLALDAAGPTPGRFGMSFGFSPEAIQVSHEYQIWPVPGTPGWVSFPVFTGVNFVVDPSVKVAGQVTGNIGGQDRGSATFGLGVTGEIGVGLSGGVPNVAEAYLTCNPALTGSAQLQLGPGSGVWNLSAGLALSGSVKLGVKLGGGAADFSVQSPSLEIFRLTGIYIDQNGVQTARMGWQWGQRIQEMFNWMERRLEDARRLGSAIMDGISSTGRGAVRVFNDVADWATSW